jgi:hypothetical protein
MRALFLPPHWRARINLLRPVQVAPVWFLAQYTFTLSLANTSVTSNTILSSSSSMFTLLASALVLRERVTAAKLASVAAVMAGAPHAAGVLLQAWRKHYQQLLSGCAQTASQHTEGGVTLESQLLLAWQISCCYC